MPTAAYDPVAKILHWLIAGLLAWQYVIAWHMPHIGRNTPNEGEVNLHLSLGASILLLVIVRLAWRLTHPVPPPGELTPWQRRAASAVHWLLYLFLVVNPLMGWLNAGYRGFQVSLFNVVRLPALVEKGNALGRAMGDIHATVGWYALILIGVHLLAALYHFVRRDDVLTRMLPRWVA